MVMQIANLAIAFDFNSIFTFIILLFIVVTIALYCITYMESKSFSYELPVYVFITNVLCSRVYTFLYEHHNNDRYYFNSIYLCAILASIMFIIQFLIIYTRFIRK